LVLINRLAPALSAKAFQSPFFDDALTSVVATLPTSKKVDVAPVHALVGNPEKDVS
jgi:hypothetical protein